MSVNKVFLLGRVGKEPTTKELSKGKVCSFTVATERKYRKDGQQVTDTEWHNIVAFQQPADFAAMHVKKGDTVYIEGSLRTRKWTDSQGEDRYVTEILASSIQKTNWAKTENKGGNTTYEERQAKPSFEDEVDAPF